MFRPIQKFLNIFKNHISLHPLEKTRDIWFQEEARAERLSNLIRILYVFFWLVATVPTMHFQPRSANLSNLGLGSLWFVFALGFQVFLRLRPYHYCLKYLSTSVDLLVTTAILYVYHYDMGYSTTLKSIPFMTYFFVLILTTLRFKKRLPLFGGVMAITLYLVLFFYMVSFKGVAFGNMMEEFTSPKVNPIQQAYRMTYLT
jgi:hypothetical protein